MDALASHIWQSTIFAMAAGALAWMCRNNSAAVRYWIWFVAAMKFLVPFAALTAVANRIPLPQSPDRAGEALQAATMMLRSSSLPPISEITSIALAAMWMFGAFVVLVSWSWQWRRVAAHARQSPRIFDGVVHDTLRRVEREEGINRPIPIVSSNQSVEPGVIGIRTPVLLWPEHLTAALNATHIEAVVAHEICHVVRRDNLFALAQVIVSALFWFHPIVWWIGARLVHERERACDEHVLAPGRRPAVYAESILQTCRFCVASPAVNVAGVTGGDLRQRIARIMKNEPARPLDARRKTALLLAALVLFLLPTAAGVSACQSADSMKPTEVVAVPAPDDQNRQVNRPGGNITTPRLIREAKPEYTPRAMHEKVQGEVLMECVVRADGTVGDKKVVKSLHPDLDQAALDAAAQWLFEPGTRDGKPVNVLVTIAMAFTLK